MQPAVLYIPYATYSHEKTGGIITFALFEEGGLLENKRNFEEDEPILASINEASVDENSDEESISTDNLEDIWDGRYVHLNINARYARLKILDHIRQTQNEWKVSELSENKIVKGLHKVFKAVVKKLNISLPTLG